MNFVARRSCCNHHWIVSPNLCPLWVLAKYFMGSISIDGAEQMVLILVLAPINARKRPLEMPYFGLLGLSFLLFHFSMHFCHSHSINNFFFFLFYWLDLGFLQGLLFIMVKFTFSVLMHIRLDVRLYFDGNVCIPELR